MTPLAYIALGILGGIFVTAPLGPVNVLIMQRALRHGFPSAVAAGSGAALADVIFAAVAAFGVSTVSVFIEGHSRIIQLVGGIVVVLIGARILWRQVPRAARPPQDERELGAVQMSAATFFLTITNPATIFGFLAYFGALGEWGPSQGDFAGNLQLVVGVAIGTLGWWCAVAGIITRLRVRLTEETIGRFNLVAGALLLGGCAPVATTPRLPVPAPADEPDGMRGVGLAPVPGEQVPPVELHPLGGQAVVAEQADDPRHRDLGPHRPHPVVLLRLVLPPELRDLGPRGEVVVDVLPVLDRDDLGHVAAEHRERPPHRDHPHRHIQPVEHQHPRVQPVTQRHHTARPGHQRGWVVLRGSVRPGFGCVGFGLTGHRTRSSGGHDRPAIVSIHRDFTSPVQAPPVPIVELSRV